MIMSLLFLISFLGGVITLIFSFGLNVILIPVLSLSLPSLSLPIELAIALSGIAYIFYNFLRILLTWRFISWITVLKFTPLALSGVIIGCILLKYVILFFTPRELKIFMGSLLLILVLLDFFKIIQKLKLKDNTFLFGGGFISGLAGGLAGFQGPFRVASLIHLELDYQTFLATSTMVGFIIDIARTIIYFFTFLHLSALVSSPLSSILLVTTIGSILGFLLFFKVTHKIKMEKFKPFILGFIIVLVIIMMFI